MNSKNFIELNGKRYDASTGTLLADVKPQLAPTAKTIRKAAPKTVDGIFRTRTTSAATAGRPSAPVKTHKTVIAQAKTPRTTPPGHQIRVTTAKPNPTVRHKLQGSHTLMRTSVKKPGPGLKKQIHVQSSLQRAIPAIIAPKTSVYSIEQHRLARSKSTPRSQQISRFAAPRPALAVSLSHVPVQPAPKVTNEPPATPAPQPAHQPLDMFEQAMLGATHFVDLAAHKAHFKKKTRRHLASMTAGAAALLVIAGFAAYQNTPGLQLKVAGFKAGVATAHTPDFKAAGFAYTGVQSSFGRLTIGLNQAGNDYELIQQNTNWSSDDMIQNISSIDASGEPDYQTLQVGNTPVYRFSNTSATWVKDGTWYQLNGGPLTAPQIQSLVKSS
jgi:hypothetical protein